MFEDTEFTIDEASRDYKLLHPNAGACLNGLEALRRVLVRLWDLSRGVGTRGKHPVDLFNPRCPRRPHPCSPAATPDPAKERRLVREHFEAVEGDGDAQSASDTESQDDDQTRARKPAARHRVSGVF